VANESCDSGLVQVNGRPVKASYDVKVGDVIALQFGARTVTVEVLSVQEVIRAADSATMYRQAEASDQKTHRHSKIVATAFQDTPRPAEPLLPRYRQEET
jgi:ribosomal 50S subunit-recycling heat shock protein